MTEPFRREYHRVVVELLEILRRLLLDRPVGAARTLRRLRRAAAVGARRVGRRIAATMGGDDLHPRELVQRPVEDQVRERDRRLERVADDVPEQPVALEPRGGVQLSGALRVDEDDGAELLGLGPERVELRVADLLAVDAAADGRAA